MAEAAERADSGFDPEQADNVVSLRGGEPGVGVARKAEGGLTLRFSLDLPKLPSMFALSTWTHQQIINGALVVAVALMAAFLVYDHVLAGGGAAEVKEPELGELRPNVKTSFNPTIDTPTIGAGTYVDRMASVIGNVQIGEHVFVAPLSSIRGDEGQPIHIGSGSNVQDFVMIHALETTSGGKPVEKNLVTVEGKKYAVFIGEGVSLAHQSQVHGPAAVGDHTFIGMQALVFKATIGANVVVEPGAKVVGVTVADGRYVPAGKVVTSQADADALPKITEDYPFATLNDGVLHVNEEFADAYLDLAHAEAGGHSGAPASASGGGH